MVLSFILIRGNWILNVLRDRFLSFCIFRFSVRVTGPSAGKCSKHPTEIARETEVTRETENSREAAREVKENTQEQFENVREAVTGWR